jgi:hypothetical protein
MEELRKTLKNLSEDTQSPDRDLNPGPPEYEAVVLTTVPFDDTMSSDLENKMGCGEMPSCVSSGRTFLKD